MAATTLSSAELWRRFSTKAEAIGAAVARGASATELRSVLPANAASTASLRQRFADVASGFAEASRQTQATDVVAAGLFAVAETGTVLVDEPQADRAACLLSEHLWLVVPDDAIVPSLDDALARIARLVEEGQRYVTLMSGPSRTADIERVLTVGVHGPRDLTVVVAGGAA